MSSATTPELGPPFNTGRALALSLAILASNAGALALTAVLINLPALAYQLFLIAVPTVEVPEGALPTDPLYAAAIRAEQRHMAILMGASMVLSAIATSTLIHRVFHQIQGKSLGLVGSLRAGLGSARTVLLINLTSAMLMFLGGLAFLVPGLLAMTMLFVAAPAAIAEGRGVIDSLRRSVELTRGSRWGLFGLVFMAFSMLVGLNLVAFLAVADLQAKIPLANPRFQAISAVLSVLFQALTSVTMTVAYLELRRKHEGASSAFVAASPE